MNIKNCLNYLQICSVFINKNKIIGDDIENYDMVVCPGGLPGAEYLSKNDKVENYEEVPYEVWGLFLEDEIPKNKVEELTAKIKTLEEEKAELEDKLLTVEREHGDYLLDNDLRITMLELGLA